MQRAVFLDRDDTLIHADGQDIGDPAAVRLIQGAASVIGSLRGLGYKIVVVSNQGGVARAKYTEADVEAVNRRIAELVRRHSSGAVIDRFYFCPFHPQATVDQYRRDHPWRKPQPGMILQAAKDLSLDLRQCWTVGDSMRDVEAGKAAGTYTILLTTQALEASAAVRPDFTARNLVEAARIIAQQPRPDREVPAERAPIAPASAVRAPVATEARISPVEGQPPRAEPSLHPSAIEWELDDQARSATEDEGSEELNTIADTAAPPVAPGHRGDVSQATAPDRKGPRPAPIRPELPDAGAPEPETNDELLSQILRELKRQRADFGDFSWAQLVAVMVQMVTIGCIIFAIAYREGEPFYQWILGAIVGQLAVIAALLASLRR